MGWAISAGSDIHIHLEHGWGIHSSVPPGLCRHSLHECLERALSSLPGSAFIKSLSVHFSLSHLLRFPPGMCFDFFSNSEVLRLCLEGDLSPFVFFCVCTCAAVHWGETQRAMGCAGAATDGGVISRSWELALILLDKL